MEETNLLFEVLLYYYGSHFRWPYNYLYSNLIKSYKMSTDFVFFSNWPDTYIGYTDTINTRHIFFMGQWELRTYQDD
jgi:hypothetical protein